MNAQIELIEGTNRDVSLSQWFTPPELAQKVVEWAGPFDYLNSERTGQPYRVLEPSAGNGALVRPLVAAGARVTACEIDDRYFEELDALNDGGVTVCGDFLLTPAPVADAARFDLCVTNPPYENGLDVAFILHALKFAPRVVGIFQAGIEYGVDRADDLWKYVAPTRILKLKRRWFKDPFTKGGGVTNCVALELVKRHPVERAEAPRKCTIEWW